jgi:hypothetical protein
MDAPTMPHSASTRGLLHLIYLTSKQLKPQKKYTFTGLNERQFQTTYN